MLPLLPWQISIFRELCGIKSSVKGPKEGKGFLPWQLSPTYMCLKSFNGWTSNGLNGNLGECCVKTQYFPGNMLREEENSKGQELNIAQWMVGISIMISLGSDVCSCSPYKGVKILLELNSVLFFILVLFLCPKLVFSRQMFSSRLHIIFCFSFLDFSSDVYGCLESC